MKKKVCIIDYGMGNITSIENSLKYLSVDYEIISNFETLKKYSHIILPGVGSYKTAMNNLKKNKLDKKIKFFVKNGDIKIEKKRNNFYLLANLEANEIILVSIKFNI